MPLRAKPGGVLEREGHTEGSVDLMRMAGLKPAAVLCELMNADGSNQRTDGYGGSLANRSRFAIELIRAVRAARPDCWIGVDANQGFAVAELDAPAGKDELDGPELVAGVAPAHEHLGLRAGAVDDDQRGVGAAVGHLGEMCSGGIGKEKGAL